MTYFWAEKQWKLLSDRLSNGTLPHGVILHGLPGLGKVAFAREFAQYVLCETPQQHHACQQCKSCQQFLAGTHPDYLVVEPEEAGKQIKIDQVRELVTQLSLTAHHGNYRVSLIQPAENMNLAAANSLLKALEEPPARTLFLLVSHRISSLLPTIKSRCQHLLLVRPEHAEAIKWLKNNHNLPDSALTGALAMAHGAPLAADGLLRSEDVVLREQVYASFRDISLGKAAVLPIDSSWLKTPLPAPINWLYSWVSDIAKYKCQQQQAIINQDKLDDLHKLAQRVELHDVLAFLDNLTALLRLQRVSLNSQMTMEELLVNWQTMTAGPVKRTTAGVGK
jgi:DNA polymerase-3 subunit delta'